MPIQKFRSSPEAPDFDEAGSLSYYQAPDYDRAAIDPDHDDATDPDYDEGSQDEFADDFRDSDAQEPSQEWHARKQK